MNATNKAENSLEIQKAAKNAAALPDGAVDGTTPGTAGTEATTTESQSIPGTKTELDTALPAANLKSLDQKSKLSLQTNPFEFLASLKPADQSTETVVEACIMLAGSVMDFWRQYGSWLSELKRRMEVRNGSKGKQLPISGVMLYWHEFLAKYFNVSRRQSW